MPPIYETKKKLPFGIFSSSVNTGYNAEISSSFAPGVDITNLHLDNYHTFENEPAQGPFTEAHVGGNQHRHVPLNTGSADATDRPEAFLINFDTSGELRIYGPDSVDTARPRATMLRGNAAKRPVNIANVRSTTGSLVLGNFTRDYEIVQTSGRRINNRFLTKAGDIPITASNSVYVTGLVDFLLPDRENTGSNKFVFVERFSAPGGPDVSSRGVLDVQSEEYAPNNALPFRNLVVRQPLQSFLTQHTDQFGYSNGSEQSASFHHVNRNTLFRPKDGVYSQNMSCLEYQFTQDSSFGELDINGWAVDASGSLAVFSIIDQITWGDSVWIYRSGSSGWAQEEIVTGSNNFGEAVSLDLDYLVVGAPDSGSGGSVVIYRSGSAGWAPHEQILNGPSASSDFGVALQKSGDLLVVGASGSISGSAYIYRSGSSGWSLEAELTGAVSGSGFGTSVALEGSFLLVGAPSASADPGEIRLFQSSSAGWNLIDTVSGDATEVDGLGWRAALESGKTIVGARSFLSASLGPKIYQVDSSGLTLEQVGAFDEVVNDLTSVDMHGGLALVTTFGASTGKLYIYGQSVNGTESSWRKIREIGIRARDAALDDNTLIVGQAIGGNAGDVYGYDFCKETNSCAAVYDNWYQQHLIPRSDLRYAWIIASAITQECDLFGYQRDGRNENRAQAYTDIEFIGGRLGDNSGIAGSFGVSTEILADFVGITGSDNGIKSSSVSTETHTWDNSILELWQNNGAYQYPIWKQIRTGEHPVARALRNENIIAVQDNPRTLTVDRTNGTRRRFSEKRAPTFVNYTEPPISSRYKPIDHQLMFKGSVNPLLAHQITHTYANNLGTFANKNLELRLGSNKDEEQAYDKIYEYYADQDLPEEDNPVARFLGLTYREVAHPREENTYLAITRGRTEYAEVVGSGSNGYDKIYGQQRTFWMDDPTETRSACSPNSQGFKALEKIISPEGEDWYKSQMLFGSDIAADKAESARFVSTAPGGSGPDHLLIFKVVEDCTYELEADISCTPNNPAFSGSLLAFQDPSSTFPDAVRVYTSSSVNGWEEVQRLSGSNGVATSSYGNGGISVWGDYIVVGSNINVPTFADEGVIDIYRSGSSGWELEQQITGTSTGGDLGAPVYIENGIIVAGENGNDDVLVNGGAIRIYESSSAGWTLSQTIYGEELGEFLSVTDFDGETIVWGRVFADTDGLTNNGLARAYRRNAANEWVKVFELAGTVDSENLTFARVDRGTILATRKPDPVNEPFQRVVDEYRETSNNVWEQASRLLSTEGTNFASDGGGLDFNSKVLAIGSRNVDVPPSNNNEGKTYFTLRNAWGFNDENFDEVEYDSRAFSPMKTDGIFSFAGSGSYRARNGELMIDSDASVFFGDPFPSLCFVESVGALISIPSTTSSYFTDYVERLTEDISGVNPWYDTYEDYAEDVRRAGKDCTIVPEFNTSEHMDFYVSENNGNFRVDNRKIFSLAGASITSSALVEDQSNYDVEFRKKYLISDKLRYFDEIKNEHEDIAAPSRVTLRCKGIKKLLPYQGFYPQNRSVQIGTLLSQSVAPFITGFSGSDSNSGFAPHGLQALLKPLVSPGILYNSIKSGIAVDYPIYTASAPAIREDGATTSEFVLQDAPNYRLPFEALVQLTEHLPKDSPVRFISTFNTQEETDLGFPYYFKWNGDKGALYEMAMHNFLAEVPNFFLADGELNNFTSAPEFQFKEFVADKTYYMDVVLQQNVLNNKFPTYVGSGSIKTDESKDVEPSTLTGSTASQWSLAGARIHKNRMIAGTRLGPFYDGTTDTESGSVVVFNNYGNLPWELEAVITGNASIPDWDVDINFANAGNIDIYENYLIIGASSAEPGAKVAAGASYIYRSGSNGWALEQQLTGAFAGDTFGTVNRLSGNYAFVFAPESASVGATHIYRSGSGGWTLEQSLLGNGSGTPNLFYGFFGPEVDRGTLIVPVSGKDIGGDTSVGVAEIWKSGSSGWNFEFAISGSGQDSTLGLGTGTSVSGAYVCATDFSASTVEVYKSGSGGWALDQSIAVSGSNMGYSTQFSVEDGFLVIGGYGAPTPLEVWRSGSTGWYREVNIDEITGSFGVDLLGAGFAGTDVYDKTFTITAPFVDSFDGAVFSFISQSSDCGLLSGWFPLFGSNDGEINQKQNGRLFGMALSITGGVVQFNKSLNVYDPAYMAYTPPSFYGEAIARISFTPTVTRKYSLEEIFENAEVQNILVQDETRVAVLADPVIAETSSLAYQNKMPVSASITLFGKFSEPNVEFDLINEDRTGRDGFQPNRATKTENTNKDRWSIGTKFECPILDVAAYDAQYSASYTSHVSDYEEQVFCDIEDLEFQTPRTPWTNYANLLPDRVGVFFDVKESFAPDIYNDQTGSLLQNCGFTAGRKKVGRLAERKDISEAIVAIPYVERPIEGVTVRNASDCNKHFIGIDLEAYRTQKENLEKLGIAVKSEETPEGKTQKSATTITDMIQKMRKFVVPPQMDFVRFDDIQPFVMYIFDFTSTLDKRDLINVWHGIMPEQAFRMEKDEVVISHEMNKDEFFHGDELPDNIRWMVFKIKQRANQNYFEVTTDSSDDNRFKFDFQGDGKVEVVPELNFNWPYDFFSLVELSKIEVEVELTNKSELDKLRQTGNTEQVAPRGNRRRALGQRRGLKGKGKKLNR